jgi:hypothetical protein
MNKRELSKYYHLSMEIKDLEEQINELMNSLIGSPILTGMPHGSGTGNPVEQKATLLLNLKNKLEKRRSEALKKLTKIELYIASMEESDVRLIFTKRYIQFKQWEDIAKEMCMSESSVFRRHREQLQKEVKK